MFDLVRSISWHVGVPSAPTQPDRARQRLSRLTAARTAGGKESVRGACWQLAGYGRSVRISLTARIDGVKLLVHQLRLLKVRLLMTTRQPAPDPVSCECSHGQSPCRKGMDATGTPSPSRVRRGAGRRSVVGGATEGTGSPAGSGPSRWGSHSPPSSAPPPC